MESYYLDWANLLLRWVHVITAIAWIGASFYFVMLDNSLEKPHDQESLDKGVGGEQWAVHGGGFYRRETAGCVDGRTGRAIRPGLRVFRSSPCRTCGTRAPT